MLGPLIPHPLFRLSGLLHVLSYFLSIRVLVAPILYLVPCNYFCSQTLPVLVKRLPPPFRAAFWLMNKLKLDKRISMKVKSGNIKSPINACGLLVRSIEEASMLRLWHGLKLRCSVPPSLSPSRFPSFQEPQRSDRAMAAIPRSIAG